MIVITIIGYGLLAIYEFVPLYKQKFWHDFWTNGILMIFSFTIAILISLNVPIPSPEKPIRELVISMFGK